MLEDYKLDLDSNYIYVDKDIAKPDVWTKFYGTDISIKTGHEIVNELPNLTKFVIVTRDKNLIRCVCINNEIYIWNSEVRAYCSEVRNSLKRSGQLRGSSEFLYNSIAQQIDTEIKSHHIRRYRTYKYPSHKKYLYYEHDYFNVYGYDYAGITITLDFSRDTTEVFYKFDYAYRAFKESLPEVVSSAISDTLWTSHVNYDERNRLERQWTQEFKNVLVDMGINYKLCPEENRETLETIFNTQYKIRDLNNIFGEIAQKASEVERLFIPIEVERISGLVKDCLLPSMRRHLKVPGIDFGSGYIDTDGAEDIDESFTYKNTQNQFIYED